MTPKLSFECHIDRIELATYADGEDQLKWDVSGVVLPDVSDDVMLLRGFLLVAQGRTWSQVSVIGFVRRKGLGKLESAALARFVSSYAEGHTEEMYDVGRRAILVNASLADVKLDIPDQAPVAAVEIIDPEDLTLEQVDEETSVDSSEEVDDHEGSI